MKKPFYITTPIYYPSGKWHLGTCYTTVICDAIARFKRLDGYDVFYLTGTDEHGQKIENKAKEMGIEPKEYVDQTVASLKDLWKLLNISYDKYIRTTDDYHKETVKKIFRILYDKGDIYKSEYEGWYCTPCESFWTETQLVDGKCPDCGRTVEKTKESSYFFRLSKYQDRIIELLENNPNFLEPKSRQNEMLNNFLRPGLQDLCVTRSTFKWGIEVPFDKDHIVYVWIDALANYISALGYLSDDDSLFQKFWPADLHLTGKEIIRFHSIIWPALLMALDLPLPKKVYGHGWLLLGSDKMSKSRGNVVDPFVLSERYSVDAVRYYLLRDVPFGQDGSYTNSIFLLRINADLCNNLGNLLSRSTAMVKQYFDGVLPLANQKEDIDQELISMCNGAYVKVRDNIELLNAPEALNEIFKLTARANKYIDETSPWILAKDIKAKDRLGTVLYNLMESLRIAAVLLAPFLPETAKKVLASMNLDYPIVLEGNVSYGFLKAGALIEKSDKLFARIDVEKEVAELEKIAAKKEEAEESTTAKKENSSTLTVQPKTEDNELPKQKPLITYDDFSKLDLKVGKIVAAEKVKKSDKLLKFSVELGAETRTIVSGIAKHYSTEDMIGKMVTVVTNLAPVKLCGVLSEGMILCADGANDSVILVAPITDCPSGSTVC